MSDPQILMRLNREAQAKLAERAAMLEEREARLRADLDRVLAQKIETVGEQEALAKSEQIYRRVFDLPTEEEPALCSFRAKLADSAARIDGLDSTRRRARLGPQRYLMFAALNETHGISPLVLAEDTRLSLKRVKDQMASDIRLGLVIHDSDDTYRLAPAGKDLLERYRAYKKASNQPLPSLDDPLTEDDQDEPETEEMMEGATQG